MASFGSQLSFFLLLVLVLCPQIQAREGKLFNFFTHFKTTYNVKAPSPITAPTPSPITAPTPSPTPAPAAAPEQGSIIVSGPAPDPGFVDSGEGYGLYGTDSNQYSPTKETPPTTTTFENELLNEDFTDEKYKTGYPKTNFYSSNNNNEVYRNSYNNQEYKSNYNNGYNKNYVDSYSKNYNYNENGFERKREGMSDTRFLENAKYYYHVNTDNENYNLNNVYESERGSTENEGFYEKRQYPNEFDTMEEYEKQQASQGYTP